MKVVDKIGNILLVGTFYCYKKRWYRSLQNGELFTISLSIFSIKLLQFEIFIPTDYIIQCFAYSGAWKHRVLTNV